MSRYLTARSQSMCIWVTKEHYTCGCIIEHRIRKPTCQCSSVVHHITQKWEGYCSRPQCPASENLMSVPLTFPCTTCAQSCKGARADISKQDVGNLMQRSNKRISNTYWPSLAGGCFGPIVEGIRTSGRRTRRCPMLQCRCAAGQMGLKPAHVYVGFDTASVRAGNSPRSVSRKHCN